MDDRYNFTLVLRGGVIDWVKDEKIRRLSQVFTWPVPLSALDDDKKPT